MSNQDAVDSYDKLEEIFLELASTQRLAIITRIRQGGNAKLSKLAKDLDVTMQEVHRNLNRLSNAGLIEKDLDGKFSLTTFGNIVLNQISTFDFLSKNRDYFSEHSFGNLPLQFVQRIGSLANSSCVKGFVTLIELWKQIYHESNEYIYSILPQIPMDLIENIVIKIKNSGIKFQYILPQHAIVPKKRTELLQKAGFHELLKNGLVERRMVNEIDIAILLNEKKATVMFPNSKGEHDMNSVFYSDDNLFHEWSEDYFKFCWNNSKSFDESKLIEV